MLNLFAFPVFFALIIVYIFVGIQLIRLVFLAFKERFADKVKNISIIISLVSMTLIFIKPNGIIDFDKLQGKDLIIAGSEGVANCTTTLKLKENNNFIFRSVCFGLTDIKGTFIKRNDTIFFEEKSILINNEDFYKFGILKRNNNKGNKSETFILYLNQKDSIGYPLSVFQNTLID
ncbi:MAG: hypothetical protein PHV20_12500 [Bacteroidales bacterium]|nr:hypothetical protein [Bacteroidales bacterium]